MKLDSWPARVLIVLSFGLYRLWARTLRLQVEDSNGVVALVRDRPVIFAIWHNRLLMLPRVFDPCFPTRQSYGLISASRDGDLIATFIERSGYGTIRGSSSRLGASAILQLTQVLVSGRDVVITPDGPRGPAYELGPGIIFLAQKSGAAVLPMNLEYSRCWRLGSWDRFIVPRPFSKVRVLIDEPHHVRSTTTQAEFESERLALQDAMMALVEMR